MCCLLTSYASTPKTGNSSCTARSIARLRRESETNRTVAGYWTSLGLPLETAEKNLGNCRVRIQSIDVAGAAELGDALKGLGVRVVKSSADLTVTLVNDYLERRLAELNRQHVSDKTDWLLVQPSGVFPLVGPAFKPGDGPCWNCLFDRMIRNREIKGFLDRGAARPVAVSPLARNIFGQSAIQFAAVETAKAIASGFRTDLRDHIVSFDLLGSTVARHRAWRRRQADHDQRRISNRVIAGNGCALRQACEPPNRRGHAAGADRCRSADEHQFFRAA